MPIEFQKDDEHSFHAEFVAAAASLRAQNYGIPSTDKLQVCVGRVLQMRALYFHVQFREGLSQCRIDTWKNIRDF